MEIILSIDVGIRNLAMCLIEAGTTKVREWDVSGIPPQHEDGVYPCMKRHLDARPWVLDATTVLIEKQPDKNRKMKSVENFLHAYFVIMGCKNTIIYDARHKIPDVAGAGKALYRKRKQTSIDRCRALLEEPGNVNAHWLDTFKQSKKKDDLADTVMQALSYINRRVVEKKPTTSKSGSRKLVARKPNENQVETKYSKSNLAWFIKNHTVEDLEKNKRFIKDMKRYYTDINELLNQVEGTNVLP